MSTPHDHGIAENSRVGNQDTSRTSSSSSDPPPQWVTAALEEYKSLRVEIIDAIQAQRQIMQIGLTGLSVLIGLGLQGINPLLAVFILALLVPTVTILSLPEHSVNSFEQPELARFSPTGKESSIAPSSVLRPLRNGNSGFEAGRYLS